jgi:4-hydroxy-4-methyl-2-oxoglutarate aldolase
MLTAADEPPLAVVSDAVLARARLLGTATLHEASGRAGALPSNLKPIDRSMRFAGRALPVRCPPGDNLWIHRALAECRPGDALVVETGQGEDYGYWGEIMATAAMVRQAAALVITGGVRDTLRLAELGLPTFAATIAIRGTGKDSKGDGAVGEPIRLGNIQIRRGDLVVGDADGVVAYPARDAERLVRLSESRDVAEADILERIRGGASTLDIYDFSGLEGEDE